MLTAFNWHVLYMLVISLIKKGKTVIPMKLKNIQ